MYSHQHELPKAASLQGAYYGERSNNWLLLALLLLHPEATLTLRWSASLSFSETWSLQLGDGTSFTTVLYTQLLETMQGLPNRQLQTLGMQAGEALQ